MAVSIASSMPFFFGECEGGQYQTLIVQMFDFKRCSTLGLLESQGESIILWLKDTRSCLMLPAACCLRHHRLTVNGRSVTNWPTILNIRTTDKVPMLELVQLCALLTHHAASQQNGHSAAHLMAVVGVPQ